MAAIGRAVGRARVHLGMCGDTGGEGARRNNVFEQVERVQVVAGLFDAPRWRVATERQDVLDAQLGVVVEQRTDVVTTCGRGR